MVGVGGASTANQTGVRRDEFEMALVAMPAQLTDRKLAFLDLGGRGVRLKACQSW